MWGPYIPGIQGTRNQHYTSSMPGYPPSSLHPLAKRTTGFAPSLSQHQGSLKRRSSITRASPGKPLSVFARPFPENSRPTTPVLRVLPKVKSGKAPATTPHKLGEMPNIEQDLTTASSSSSLIVRSGNQDMIDGGSVIVSTQERAPHHDERRDSNRTPEPQSPQLSKIVPVKSIDQLAGESSRAGLTKRKEPLAPNTNESTTKSRKLQPKDQNGEKFPALRFSPEKPRYKGKLFGSKDPASTSPGSLRRTAIENRVKSTDPKSSNRNDIYAWRSTVARKKVRVTSRSARSPGHRSRIPIPVRLETPQRDDDLRTLNNTPTPIPTTGPEDEGPSPDSERVFTNPASIQGPETESDMGPSPGIQPASYTKGGNISELRNQFLQALRIQEINLPSLSDYLQNISFDSVLKDKLREIKIEEIYQRIGVVRLLHYSSGYHGANENELGCIKGWMDDLTEELWMIECEKVQPSKVWFDQIFRWLWSRKDTDDSNSSQYDTSQNDDLYVICDAAPLRVLAAKKEHELFNLRDTAVELLKNGFRNKEKKMIEYWVRVRGISTVPTACGDDIIGIYMRKLTRWDKIELPESQIQKRRMWYFCLEHYVNWKEAVSHYALALKMMNLLIVFHDLWGMHVEGMSNQEKKDFGVLHDNLYRFATIFQRPIEGGDYDPIWQENECMYCFSKIAASRICEEERGKNLWMWLAQLASIAGYGKYYATIMRIMTEGKEPEYVNQLFETHFWSPRTCSMMAGLKRIKDAMKKHAGPGDRMGLGAKKNGGYNKY